MISWHKLSQAVDTAFAVTARDLPGWPDPHPDKSPADEEYSRLTNPGRWRIIGARVEAWTCVLEEHQLIEVHDVSEVRWSRPPGPEITRATRLVPRSPGALNCVIARIRLDDVADAGVVIGVGDPATCLQWFPDCGCDACDSGSEDVLVWLDDHLRSIVTGTLRRLTSGDRTITALADGHWSAEGPFARGEIAAVLTDPTDWSVLAGSSWLEA